MGNLDAPLMALNEEPQGQMGRYTKETYIFVKHNNYEKIPSSTEHSYWHRCVKKKVIFHKRSSSGGHLIF